MPLGDGAAEIGARVFAIGNPLGLPWSYSNGTLSAVRDWTSRAGLPVRVLQTDTSIAPGSSGGGLWHVDAYAELAPDRAQLAARLAVLYRLAVGGDLAPRLIVTSAPALLRRVMPPAELRERSLSLTAGATIDRDATAARLVAAGFARTPLVEDAGTFAVRGNVIDVGTPLHPFPVRVELDGDRVDSLRLFDPASQRTLRTIDVVHLHPVRDTIVTGGVDWKARLRDLADALHHPSRATRALIEQIAAGDFVGIDVLTPAFHAAMVPVWDYAPDARWLWWDPDAAVAAVDGELAQAAAGHAARLRPQAGVVPTRGPLRRARRGDRSPDPRSAPDRAADPGAGRRSARGRRRRTRVNLDELRPLRGELERARLQHDDHLAQPVARAIAAWRADGLAVIVTADSAQRADRTAGLLGQYGLPCERTDDFDDAVGAAGPTATRSRSRSRRCRAASSAAPIGLAVLDRGRHVRRQEAPRPAPAAPGARPRTRCSAGSATSASSRSATTWSTSSTASAATAAWSSSPTGGAAIDFLHLEYDGGTCTCRSTGWARSSATSAPRATRPRLDKLGGVTWDKAKRKVSKQVAALAEELLQLYAQRAALPGHRFPPADELYHEFEAAFPFEETPDQLAAIEATLATWRAARRWTAWSAATSATARPRSRCARSEVRAGRQAGRAPGADHDPGRAARPHDDRALRVVAGPGRQAVAVPEQGRAARDPPRPGRRRPRRRRRHPPRAVGRRPHQGPRAGRHRRGAAVRRRPQGAAEEAARPHRRPDPDRDADPAHPAPRAHRHARPVDHRHPARRSPRGPDLRRPGR
jgi:transcription-repair coupling factor (superfamily II helicase)